MYHQRDLILNKILSAGLTALALWLVSLLPARQNQWNALILIIAVLGQGHFITTYIYHFRALPPKLPRRRDWAVYWGLVALLCAAFWVLRWGYDFAALVTAFTAVYFLFHHILNERTQAAPGERYYPETFLAFGLALMVFLPTLNDPSFSYLFYTDTVLLADFSHTYEFETLRLVSPELVRGYQALVLLFCIVCAVRNIRRGRRRLAALLAAAALLALALTHSGLFGDFLYFLTFLILYHYVTWFLFFLFRYGKEAERGRQYRRVSLWVYAGLVALYALGQWADYGLVWDLFYVTFSLPFFLFWTFLHITVTLINEPPVARLLLRRRTPAAPA